MEELVGITELSGILKISPLILKRMAKAGRIPRVKIGKHYLYSIDAVRQRILAEAYKIPEKKATVTQADKGKPLVDILENESDDDDPLADFMSG